METLNFQSILVRMLINVFWFLEFKQLYTSEFGARDLAHFPVKMPTMWNYTKNQPLKRIQADFETRAEILNEFGHGFCYPVHEIPKCKAVFGLIEISIDVIFTKMEAAIQNHHSPNRWWHKRNSKQ